MEALNNAAKKYLDPNKLKFVVVGNTTDMENENNSDITNTKVTNN